MSQYDDIPWGAFYQIYAMSTLIAWAVLLVGMLAYGLYRVDLLPLFFMLSPLLLILASVPLMLEYDYSVYKDFFLGVWMNPVINLIFFLLGIISIAVPLAALIYYEDGSSKKGKSKTTITQINDEEAENNRKLLGSKIQAHAITVRFLKRKWNFTQGKDVLFGYDEDNKQFVFVNEQNSYTLSSSKIIYLDFEDVSNDFGKIINTKEYQRLVKLYYLSSGKKEGILHLAQISASGEEIKQIKHYANSNPPSNPEVIFRRKIRHRASALTQDNYPCRPFINDEWFEMLKECMEKFKNNKTDGYSLFRDKIIAADNYMNDEMLFSIICDLSMDPPDKTSAKKEARQLCLQDFGDNIKLSVKQFFHDT